MRKQEAVGTVPLVSGKLSEVRARHASLEMASLFVEKLYGRNLRNDPGIGVAVLVFRMGGYVPRDNEIWLMTGCQLDSFVHELVHAEDLMGREKELGYRESTYFEGRAVFAERLFTENKKVTHPDVFPEIPWILCLFLLPFALASGLGENFRYGFFYKRICRIAKKVGDPIKAFQITTEKIPTTWKELLFSSKFYKEEIAAAKKEMEIKKAEN